MVHRSMSNYKTTTCEQFLLALTVILLPLESHIPPIAGFSIMFIVFLVMASYVFLYRYRILSQIWLHPVFVAGYTIVILGSLMEFFHPHPSLTKMLQFSLMIAGGVTMASLCRDRRALRAGLYGYLVSGLWVGIIIFSTSYGGLSGASANNFFRASQIRTQVFADAPLYANLNAMSIICAQGTFVALVLALSEQSFFRRSVFFSSSLFCFVATFLPMSRSGVVSLIVFFGVIVWKYGIQMKTIIAALAVGACILILVPDVIVSRLTFSADAPKNKMEARAYFYKVAFDHLPEYAMTGVGAGNFWGAWGKGTGFYKKTYGIVYGPHNCYILVTIYWGLAGLAIFFNLIYQGFRSLPPKQHHIDPLAVCVLGIAVSLLLMTFYSHTGPTLRCPSESNHPMEDHASGTRGRGV